MQHTLLHALVHGGFEDLGEVHRPRAGRGRRHLHGRLGLGQGFHGGAGASAEHAVHRQPFAQEVLRHLGVQPRGRGGIVLHRHDLAEHLVAGLGRIQLDLLDGAQALPAHQALGFLAEFDRGQVCFGLAGQLHRGIVRPLGNLGFLQGGFARRVEAGGLRQLVFGRAGQHHPRGGRGLGFRVPVPAQPPGGRADLGVDGGLVFDFPRLMVHHRVGKAQGFAFGGVGQQHVLGGCLGIAAFEVGSAELSRGLLQGGILVLAGFHLPFFIRRRIRLLGLGGAFVPIAGTGAGVSGRGLVLWATGV